MADLDTRNVLWVAGSLAQSCGKPFSEALFLQSFPPPYGFADLARIFQSLGLAARLHRKAPLSRIKTPCALELTPDEALGGAPIAILIRVEGDTAWLFTPGDQEPRAIPLAQLSAIASGRAVECRPAARPLTDPDLNAAEPFGYRWFLPFLLKHRAIWRDVLVASLLIQLIALATPLFTQVIIDKVVVHQTMSTLIVIAAALVVFVIFGSLLTWVRQYLVLHTGNRVDAVLGVQVLEHLMRLPMRYFEHRSTGVIAARMQAVEQIREFVASSLVTLLLDIPFLLVFVAVMFLYSVPLTLLVLGVLGVIAGLCAFVAPVFRRRLNQQFMLGARNQAFLTEFIGGLETVKSLQMEPQLVRRWRADLASYLQAGFETRQIANTYNVVASALEQLMTLSVLTVGAWIVMSTSSSPQEGQAPFTIGMLVAFQMFASRLSQPLMRLVGLWQQLQQANVSVRRLADIMDAPREPYSATPAREAKDHGHVEVVDVAFRYSDERPFLYQHLNITLKAGTTTVLVGPSGSGKSTLAKLLQGFYLPSAGQIRIDGTDIRHLSANELRAYFGVVPQDVTLFSGTIYENLTLANPHATFDMVVHACRMAEIHSTIEALPQGYQTEIGERGVGLSGGQKQRMAIARALLKRPKILVFDEATSALDAETSEHLARTINALRGRVSVLFIAHQVPKSLQVDEVVRIGDRNLSVVSAHAPARSAAAHAEPQAS